MSGYDFLKGLRVLEVAQLGPASLGGILADMGAEVIKVEGPDGDPVRHMGKHALGSPDGIGFLHLRWNRGKKSVGIDLKKPDGRDLFLRLARRADVVIEGMRAGVLNRLGLGYDELRKVNPRVVFCSLSGLGGSGPYHKLAAHAPSFDAVGGLAAVQPYALPKQERRDLPWVPVAMHAMGRDAAIGVLAAVIRAGRTGEGAVIEVTGAEAAVHWLPDGMDVHLNPDLTHRREPPLMNSRGKMVHWPRLYPYDAKDGRRIFFQCVYPKYWRVFCNVVERPDLLALYDDAGDVGAADEAAFVELSALFRTRSADEWMALALAHDIPMLPVNTAETVADDPHFAARGNVVEIDCPGLGPIRVAATPVRTPDQAFLPGAPPAVFEHTAEVLSELAGVEAEELAQLRAAGVVLASDDAR